MKKFYEKYRHVLPVIVYFVIYMTWFNYIETNRASQYTVIHMNIDDKIPFVEYFIVPYYMWFVYVIAVVGYLMVKDKDGYYRNFIFLSFGMTVFLVISTLFPNIQHLRPYIMPRDNVFAHMVKHLYSIDTPTNLWPSIHVYNSIGAYFGVIHNEKLRRNRFINYGSLTLSILIIMSTVFLKQHSMFDVMTAFIMATVVYVFVYRLDVIISLKTNYLLRRHGNERRI
ncbi:MAG: phosphatase PAP2 family protein [Lachnospiraceae bacterium]|nr:phosphatase PAP2 family protein [Lachnospiraceae bacterium]